MAKERELTISEVARRGGKKGGLATGHKGFRAFAPEKCQEIWDKAALSNAIIPKAARPPEPQGQWLKARNAVLASVATDTVKRAYRNGIDYFVYWLRDRPLTDGMLEEHQKHLQHPGRRKEGYSESSINVRMSAIRRAVCYYNSNSHR